MTAPSLPTPAVFLSYAREDTPAVVRLAEALRAAGVEVWFDQNELVGGDAWDRKIRSQIKECALFLPVVSANTNARAEGYFRLEWLLAVERSRLMADDKAFLVPVVIDATAEAAAKVPDKFRDVQWTRLPGGETSPAFVARVQKLLAPSEVAPASSRPSPSNAGKMPALPKPGTPFWMWPAVAVLAIGVAAFFLARKSESPAAPAKPVAESKPAAPAPAPMAAPALPPLAPEKSVAVLPFENLSPDKDNAFFADGVHLDVITSLTKIRDLKVIGRTSVLSYRDPAARNHKQIAADLGVATLLEGTVRRAGTKVRVTAQLLNARTDETLWAETYDLDLTDVFTIQSALAQNITAALKANFTSGERALVSERLTKNQEAYDLFQRGLTTFENGNVNNAGGKAIVERALSFYEQAVEKDPTFAAAYAQIAYLNGRLYWYPALDPSPARKQRAKEALNAALRIAPNELETRRAAGAYAYYCDRDWARALTEFRAAAVALPNDAQLVYFMGLSLRRMGNMQEAAKYFARSMELNPRELIRASTYVQTLGYMRHYAEANELATRYLAMFPDASDLTRYRVEARFELSGDRETYFREREAVPFNFNDPRGLSRHAHIALLRGDFASADEALANLGVPMMSGPGGGIDEPVALHRANVAFLRGQREEARRFADQALDLMQGKESPALAAMVNVPLAHALAGRTEKALAATRESMHVDDLFNGLSTKARLAQVYLILGRRDDAFAILRELMTGPGDYGPQYYRIDPWWMRVKDDPRFEEILKLAKPL